MEVIIKNTSQKDIERAGRVFRAGKERHIHITKTLTREIKACPHLVVIGEIKSAYDKEAPAIDKVIPSIGKKETKKILKEVLGSKMYLLEDDEGLSKELIANGIREKASTEYMRNILRPDWTAIDIGANLGYYALFEASKVKKVYAIEPVRRSFETLNESIELNKYKNIKTYNYAIGSKNRIFEITVLNRYNWSTMLDFNMMINKFRKQFEGSFRETQKIQVLTLDEFVRRNKIEKINFIRMDVEGYEVEIIKGAEDVLSSMPIGSFLTIEFHSILFKDKKPFIGILDKILESGFKIVKGTWRDRVLDLSEETLRDRLYNRGTCLQVFFKKNEK